jgi:ubiquinone/menaquinone biosynthesis C-methylase UbiE
MSLPNQDDQTVVGFGDEWQRFDQSALAPHEAQALFDAYFSLFDWHHLPDNAEGFDLGCGSGRWAKLVAPRVGRLHCIDPSPALDVAKRNLHGLTNVEFHAASVDAMPIGNDSMDFGYSLGVIHHIPDPQAALNDCVRKLKRGAPLLVYLYYAFDNRPPWFQAAWRLSEILRHGVCRLPYPLRYAASQILALVIYWPLARLARLLEALGVNVAHLPLSAYRRLSFYTMRTDALDRFGTRLEQRFTRSQIARMLEQAGLEDIRFAPHVPYWCAIGVRANEL